MSSSSCARCHQPINEKKIIEWNQREYHSECFRCFKCKKSLKNRLVYSSTTTNDEFFCSSCFKKDDSMSPCFRCRKKFQPKTNFVEIDQHLFHDDCFVCSSCGKSLLNIEFYRQDKSTKYLCEKCYETTLDRCELCREIIRDGHIVKFRDKIYHDSCMKCSSCQGEFVGSNSKCFVQTNKGLFYCRSCDEKDNISSI